MAIPEDRDLNVRPARTEEVAELSRVASRAKAHWGYSPRQIERWRDVLTVTAESVLHSPTFVAETGGRVAGFCQVCLEAGRAEVEHLWVDPEFLRRGVGRRLLACALDRLATLGYRELEIDADPNAEGFYARLGAWRIGWTPAPIEGDPQRRRPLLRLRFGAVTAPRRRPRSRTSPSPS